MDRLKRLISASAVCLMALPVFAKDFPAYKTETLASGLSKPWAVTALQDGRILITEKTGQLRVFKDGKLSEPVAGVPDVYYRAQGGLLDVRPHPDFANNQTIYLSFAAGDKTKNALRLVSAKLEGNKLSDVKELFTAKPWKDTPVHYGGRIRFLPDGTLLLSSGDGYNFKEQAQQLDSHLGKIVRLNEDGSVPKDNPFVGQKDKLPEIWSYGHRNPQGIVYDEKNNLIISHEHGPKGGDEINLLSPGKNYGWPVITYGVDYSGAEITPYREYQGMEQPHVNWTPSIAPSGMVIYQGDAFGDLTGDLLVTTLKYRLVRWVQMDGKKVIEQKDLFTELDQRLRDITLDKDGNIYLITDSGNLIKVSKPS